MRLVDIAQTISAVGTMIAAIVAVIAAFQSYRSAKQNNETNEQMIRPRVVVLVRSTKAAKNFIDLVVLNDGGGVARNIQLNVEQDDLELTHQYGGKKHISDLNIFKSGISTLPAGTEREYFILSLVGRYEEILQKESIINVSYRDTTNKKLYSDSFTLDFASLSESGWTTDEMKSSKVIADELPKIAKALDMIGKKK